MLLAKITEQGIRETAEVLGTCECGKPAQIVILGQFKFICMDCDNETRTQD